MFKIDLEMNYQLNPYVGEQLHQKVIMFLKYKRA